MSGFFLASYIIMWLILLGVGVLLLLIYRHFGLIALGTEEGVERDGLPVGASAPFVRGVEATGNEVIWTATAGRAHFLAFVSPECEPCEKMIPLIGRFAEAHPEISVALVVSGPADVAARLIAKFHPPCPCIAERREGLYNGYLVRVTPFAFAIGPDGRIRSKGLCSDPGRLQRILASGGLPVDIPSEGSVRTVEFARSGE